MTELASGSLSPLQDAQQADPATSGEITRSAERHDNEPQHDDQRMLSAIRRGDEQGLADLYDRYAGPAYSLALHMLGDPAAAQDCVAAVFAQIWRNPDTFATAESGLETRLLATTKFEALQLLLSRQSAKSPDARPSGGKPATDQENRKAGLLRRGEGGSRGTLGNLGLLCVRQ